VYSEKELIREFEKIAATLVPEKDWSMRISAMRRVEGLVAGGTTSILFVFIFEMKFYFLVSHLMESFFC